eukprot:scaffold2693_cov139-Isochrysis_galbana.AAC.10
MDFRQPTTQSSRVAWSTPPDCSSCRRPRRATTAIASAAVKAMAQRTGTRAELAMPAEKLRRLAVSSMVSPAIRPRGNLNAPSSQKNVPLIPTNGPVIHQGRPGHTW